MTQADKELLLKDLCARLPYGVKCSALLKQIDRSLKSVFGTFKGYNGWANVGNNLVAIETVRPYLRPMSSMTEEEEKEYAEIVVKSQNCSYKNNESATTMVNDWYLSKGFDVRGLIPKGLALEASKDMYNFNR